MSSRITGVFYLLVGIMYFLTFAMDIEIDKDFMTWIWLLSSELCFMMSMRYFIIYDREKVKERPKKEE